MNDLLLNKAQSGFPVSIGTGLSLETILTPIQPVYDESRVFESIADTSIYSLYIFNISTLLRNIIQSVKYSDLVIIPKKDIYENLLEEIDFISTFFDSNNLRTKFYINTYTYVKDTYGSTDKLRKSTTEKQLFIDDINSYCLNNLRKEDDVDVFHKDVKYSKEDSALIFTHIPFDLLSHSNFLKLDLLESHTGIIKTRKDWWTKYFPIPNHDMSFLPLFEYLLTIFGDHVMFSPSSVKERIEVWENMKKINVNPLTSEFSLLTKMNRL